MDEAIRSYFRGHAVYYDCDGRCWRYQDNGAPAGFDDVVRPCAACGRVFSGSNGGYPDPCLGTLPGVDNACCGHGVPAQAYIRFTNGVVLRGFTIIEPKE